MAKPILHSIKFTEKELKAILRFASSHLHLHSGSSNMEPHGRIQNIESKVNKRLKKIAKEKQDDQETNHN